MSLKKEDLDGQFVLTQDPEFIPASWNTREKASWVLATHPSLPITDARTEKGDHFGWIIGYPITSDFQLCSKEIVFSVAVNEKLQDQVIESNLYEMGGRFVGIFLSGGFSRLYLDPCGSLSVVYSTEVPVVTSTPSLIDSDLHQWDRELINALKMPDSGLWYPSGVTPRKFVSRLLPNHYLDLSRWHAVRHWPNESGLEADADSNESVRKIVSIVGGNISAVAKKHSLYLNLTAGRDTRKVLACARKKLDRIQFFTFFPGKETVDSHVACVLSSKFNLNHILLPVEHANKNKLDNWLFRTGHCVSGEIWRIHQTQRHLDVDRAVLPGLCGELGRGQKWRENDHEKSKINAKELLNRYGIPTYDKILTRTEDWLAEVAHFNTFLILDLMYIEQRLGCWCGPQTYGADDFFRCVILPFSHRQIFESMLTLPFEYKKRKQLTIDICKQEWPELLDLPFNELPGLIAKLMKYKKKVMWHVKRRLPKRKRLQSTDIAARQR